MYMVAVHVYVHISSISYIVCVCVCVCDLAGVCQRSYREMVMQLYVAVTVVSEDVLLAKTLRTATAAPAYHRPAIRVCVCVKYL